MTIEKKGATKQSAEETDKAIRKFVLENPVLTRTQSIIDKIDKLKKKGILPLKKSKGGGADMGAPERAQERADRGYGSTAGVDRSAVGPGSKFAENTNTQNLSTNKKSGNQNGE